MLKSRFLLTGNLFTLCTLVASSQTRLTGEVVDADNGEPLIGANILIKGTSTGTVTDFDGSFEMRVDNLPVTLEISYIGYTYV